MTTDAPVLGLSGLFVLVSIKVFPAWFGKHRSTDPAVRIFAGLALASTIAATVWLTWEVASLGVQHSPSHQRAPLYGTVFGVPIVLIPLAILLAFVAIAELRSVGVPALSFSFGKRKDAEMLDSIRGQISGASSDTRVVLADAISQIESSVSNRIEERARLQASTGTAVESLKSAVVESASDVADIFERVAALCTSVAERIEAQQLEPDPLADVIARLTSEPAAPLPAPVADDIEIDLVGIDEISLVDEQLEPPEPEAVPVPVSPVPSPGRRDNGATGTLTAVERLRRGAQRVSREVWTRSKSQPSRTSRRRWE